MTSYEQASFDSALNAPVEQFPALPKETHISRAKEIYIAIRPALTSAGWVVGLLKPKFKKGIDILIVMLDNLFNAIQ